MPVVDDHAVAVDAEPARVEHRAGVRGDDRHVLGDREIEAEVDLLIDLLALVDVGAVIGEARPRPASCRAGRTVRPTASSATSCVAQRRDLVRVDLAQLAVDRAGTPAASPAVLRRRRHLQLGRVLEDLRHDAVDELVVELDPALLERLLEHVVDEGRRRLVAGLVARERDDRRVERPDRRAARRTRPSAPGRRLRRRRPTAGSPGYSTSPTRTPDATSGGVAR